VTVPPKNAYRWICRPTLSILGRQVSSYLVLLYIGCTTGVLVGSASADAWGAPGDTVAVTAIALIAAAFIGSRILYVATHFDLFRVDFSRLWRRLDGGGALYGGLLLAVAVSPAVLAVSGLEFLEFWDAASVIMLVGLAITKVGCLMRGCCAGRPTAASIGRWLPDDTGSWQRRYPSQLLEAGWALAILVAAWAARIVWPAAGVVFGCAIVLYGAGRIPLELTRLTERRQLGRQVNIAISAALMVAGSMLLAGLA
jgi:phosphatidylglycerol---prolipoprotein diacylglyceryl transferase